jgi:hypothetical protein
MEASCWVARKIFLSAASASSRARTLDSRPTTNGVIMKGKMTTSRMGIMGSFLVSNFSLDVVTQSPLGLMLMTVPNPARGNDRLPATQFRTAESSLPRSCRLTPAIS